MMTFALSVISDRLQALTRALDADPALPGKLVIYDGPRPSSGDNPDPVSSVLATCVFPRPSLDSVTTFTLRLRQPLPTMVQTTGLATWARLVDGTGCFVADVDVGTDDTLPLPEVIIRKANGDPAATANLYAGGEFAVVLARLVDA